MEGPGSQHFGACPPGVVSGLSLEGRGTVHYKAGLGIEEHPLRDGEGTPRARSMVARRAQPQPLRHKVGTRHNHSNIRKSCNEIHPVF